MSIQLDPIDAAVRAIAAGGAVVVVDDEDRENEGDIIFAAQHATPELMGFTVRYTSGVACVPLPGDWAATSRRLSWGQPTTP
ncbi:MAG: 3,4-dihydroxy-2-butanone-4-phosphate synthase, partial [Arthrobacter sp.]